MAQSSGLNIVFISGPSKVGKTTLASNLASTATEHGLNSVFAKTQVLNDVVRTTVYQDHISKFGYDALYKLPAYVVVEYHKILFESLVNRIGQTIELYSSQDVDLLLFDRGPIDPVAYAKYFLDEAGVTEIDVYAEFGLAKYFGSTCLMDPNQLIFEQAKPDDARKTGKLFTDYSESVKLYNTFKKVANDKNIEYVEATCM